VCADRGGVAVQASAEPALPGRSWRPLEGVTPKAAQGCFFSRS